MYFKDFLNYGFVPIADLQELLKLIRVFMQNRGVYPFIIGNAKWISSIYCLQIINKKKCTV